MNKDLVKELYLSFFYLGKSPIAPGTVGTLGGVLVSYLAILFLDDFAGYFLLALIIIMYYFGVVLAPWAEEKYGKDPGTYVLDEVIGYLIIIVSLYLLQYPMNEHNWALSFTLFRIFDVVKLWPAKALENLQGGHGILMDDIAAGFQTLIVLIIIENYGAV
jgi:phosphatidylglycerophosphatase A